MNAPEMRSHAVQHAERALRDTIDLRTAVLVVAAIAIFLYLIKLILLPFIVAGITAYVCSPLLDWFASRTRLPRALFAVLLFVLMLAVASLITATAGQPLIAEMRATVSDLQGTLEQLLREANGGAPIQIFGLSIGPETVHDAFDRMSDWFSQPDHVALLTGYGLMTIIGVFLTAVLLIWFLITGPGIARGLFWLVPPSRRELVSHIWMRLDPVLKHYFIGVAGTVVYATVAAYVGLALFLDLNHAVLLALLTGVAETLPFIGSTAVAIIAGLVALHTATGIMSIVAFTIYATVLRLSIDQVVAPLVLGRAANVHPVLIIFCFLAGAVTYGVAGVILSVPVALTIKITLAVLYGDDDAVQPTASSGSRPHQTT
jgi:predicted PurR-regulated permease PerM